VLTNILKICGKRFPAQVLAAASAGRTAIPG
jgi:hypothetical protein